MKKLLSEKLKSRYSKAMLFFALMLAVSVVGVSAWLADASGIIKNKFDAKTLEIDIEETDTGIDPDPDPTTNSYKITFGDEGWDDMTKDPEITLPADQVDCWVFAKVEEKNDFSTYLTYEIDSQWTALGEEYPGIYWRRSESSPESQDFNVLKNKTVKVRDGVTKDQINALTEDTYPKLDITGFAIQMTGFDTAQAAWEEISRQ